MKKMLKSTSGFTMIELMIVVIIVGILAAAAVPLYTGYVRKAIRTEAEASLGAIRTAERIYKLEYGTYVNATAATVSSVLGVDVTDTHYFSSDCYTVTGASATAFNANCAAASSTAPSASQAQTYFTGSSAVIHMDEEGTVTEGSS